MGLFFMSHLSMSFAGVQFHVPLMFRATHHGSDLVYLYGRNGESGYSKWAFGCTEKTGYAVRRVRRWHGTPESILTGRNEVSWKEVSNEIRFSDRDLRDRAPQGD